MLRHHIRNFVLAFFIFLVLAGGRSMGQNWVFARGSNSTYNVDAWSVKTDTAGNIFCGGMRVTPGTGPTTFGSLTLPFQAGMYPCFWVKYSPSGTPLWAGGTNNGDSWLYDIATDAAGNLVVLGAFTSDSLQIGPFTLHNAYGSTGAGQYFLAKIDPSGSVLWAVNDGNAGVFPLDYLSNMEVMKHGSVCTDNAGNIYITSSFTRPSITIGSFTLTNSFTTGYINNIFVAKYNPSGSVIWAKATEDSTIGHAFGITVTPNGNVYVAGDFSSPRLTAGSVTISNPYSMMAMHGYVLAFSSSGTPLWAQGFGGSDYYRSAYALGTASDTAGNVYVTGAFEDTSVSFGSLVLTRTYPATVPWRAMYLVKYSGTGTALWATSIGAQHTSSCCANGVWGYGIATAPCGRIWVAGRFVADITVNGTTLSPYAGINDPLFIAGYSAAGAPVGAASLASGAEDQCQVACDPLGNVIVAADYAGTMLVAGPDTLNSVGGESFYVAKYTPARDTAFSRTDTALCKISDSYVLGAPPGYYNWYWSNGGTSASTAVTAPGTYILHASGYCSDLVDTFHVTLLPDSNCTNLVNPFVMPEPSVYPNPAHTSVTICNAAATTVVICDMPGREMKRHICSSSRDILDISGLAPGAYVMHFCDKAGNRKNVLLIRN